jgi:hypothetical protein
VSSDSEKNLSIKLLKKGLKYPITQSRPAKRRIIPQRNSLSWISAKINKTIPINVITISSTEALSRQFLTLFATFFVSSAPFPIFSPNFEAASWIFPVASSILSPAVFHFFCIV